MNRLDMPEAYDDLSLLEKELLAEWIDQVMCSATRYFSRSSYGIKHDFEREGFYVTNGQFKGAMLAAGYHPQNSKELNWVFKIKPVSGVGMRGRTETFAIGSDNERYAALRARVREEHQLEAEARAKAKQSENESSAV